jgi:hypothetical protein
LRDTRSLRSWAEDPEKIPVDIAAFRFDAELLTEGRRRNEMVLRGYLGYFIAHGAQDWRTGLLLSEPQPGDPIELHHIFPKASLGSLPKHLAIPEDPLVGFAALARSSNRRLLNTAASDLLERGDIDEAYLATQGLNGEMLRRHKSESAEQHVRRFMSARAEAVLAVVRETTGWSPIDETG